MDFSNFTPASAVEAADQDIENTWDINSATITLDSGSFDEGNRDMYAAPVGTMTADVNGEIKVYIHNASVGNRVWYDGLGYKLISQSPTNLITSIQVQNGIISLNWSAASAVLQESTNLTDGAGWYDVSGATSPYEPVTPNSAVKFFRLRQP